MGIKYVAVTVRNPADYSRFWEGPFVVDTGAIDCVVPRQHLGAIGLATEGRRISTPADGSRISRDIIVVRVEFRGEIAGAAIAMGDESAEPP